MREQREERASVSEDRCPREPARRLRRVDELRDDLLHHPAGALSDTYNKQPACCAALAARKNYYAVYLMGVYGDPKKEELLADAYKKLGKKMDMGKSCLRFKSLDDIPLDVVGKLIASVPPEELIEKMEKATRR